jgi:carbamoylphosphate synthase large subunit
VGGDGVRILLSEGSSTNAREMITALGVAGHRVDLCDPEPLCLGRFSRFVRRVHRCPSSGGDPIGYLRFLKRLLERERYDVLFPANEQAYLFSWARDLLDPLTRCAVAPFDAFRRVQTKAAFTHLLDDLGLGHPVSSYASTWSGIEQAVAGLGTPCYVKTDAGTASTGVWRIPGREALALLREELTAKGLLERARPDGFVVQRQAEGHFEQSHGIFDNGRLIALRCTRRTLEGVHGGAAAKRGVARAAVERDYEILGEALTWHGSFSADYFWDEEAGRPSYIDANPRITEPMNALFNGVNLADLQVRLSLGERLAPIPHSTHGASSHTLVQVMLRAAGRGGRREVLRETVEATFRRGAFRDSHEGLTPALRDLPSAVPVAAVLGSLLVHPPLGRRLAEAAIARYSLGEAVSLLARSAPEDHGFRDVTRR